MHKPGGEKERGRVAAGPRMPPVNCSHPSLEGARRTPRVPPDCCRALAPPPPHGSVLRQPLLTAFSHHRPRAAGEASWKPELGERGHSTSRPSARGRGQGEGREQTTGGPQPAAPTHPPL